MNITASKLYNYIQCPHCVWSDIYGFQDEKQDEENAFLQLVSERIGQTLFFRRTDT